MNSFRETVFINKIKTHQELKRTLLIFQRKCLFRNSYSHFCFRSFQSSLKIKIKRGGGGGGRRGAGVGWGGGGVEGNSSVGRTAG